MKIGNNRKSRKINKRVSTQKGITLIALVITIIVMLILAGVVITMVVDSGIFTKAQESSEQTNLKADEEMMQIAVAAAFNPDTGMFNPILLELPEGFTKENNVYISPSGNEFTIDGKGNVKHKKPSGPLEPYKATLSLVQVDKGHYSNKIQIAFNLFIEGDEQKNRYILEIFEEMIQLEYNMTLDEYFVLFFNETFETEYTTIEQVLNDPNSGGFTTKEELYLAFAITEEDDIDEIITNSVFEELRLGGELGIGNAEIIITKPDLTTVIINKDNYKERNFNNTWSYYDDYDIFIFEENRIVVDSPGTYTFKISLSKLGTLEHTETFSEF